MMLIESARSPKEALFVLPLLVSLIIFSSLVYSSKNTSSDTKNPRTASPSSSSGAWFVSEHIDVGIKDLRKFGVILNECVLAKFQTQSSKVIESTISLKT